VFLKVREAWRADSQQSTLRSRSLNTACELQNATPPVGVTRLNWERPESGSGGGNRPESGSLDETSSKSGSSETSRRTSEVEDMLDVVNPTWNFENALCFWINVHNALFLLAWMLRGRFTPQESAEHKACLRVGSHLYTLRDIREGILLGDETVIGPSDERYPFRMALKRSSALYMLLLARTSHVGESVCTRKNLRSETEAAARQVLNGSVELDVDGAQWTLPQELALIAKAHGGSGLEVAEMLVPYMPQTWQALAVNAVAAKKAVVLCYR
jgi:hypothetical protein